MKESDKQCTAVASDLSLWYEREEKYLKVYVPLTKVNPSKFDDVDKPLFFLWQTGGNAYSVTYVARVTGVTGMTATLLRPLLTTMRVTVQAVRILSSTLISQPSYVKFDPKKLKDNYALIQISCASIAAVKDITTSHPRFTAPGVVADPRKHLMYTQVPGFVKYRIGKFSIN